MTVFSSELRSCAERILIDAESKRMRICCAESCTGGLIAALFTDIPGASRVFERGFVCYANQAKIEMLGVPHEMLELHGAVSSHVARAMALGALMRSEAEICVAVTGIAGPDGGTEEKPVGLVHIAAATREHILNREFRFGEIGRDAVRMQTVAEALAMTQKLLESVDS